MNKLVKIAKVLKNYFIELDDSLLSSVDSILDQNQMISEDEIDVHPMKNSKKILETLKNKNNSLISAKTGSGKSFSIRSFAIENYKNKIKTFIIVPTKQLINEYNEEFKQKGFNDVANFILKKYLLPRGDEEKFIFVLTQERFSLFFGNKINKNIDTKEFVLIIDEAHHLLISSGNLTYRKEIQFKNKSNLEREILLLRALQIGRTKFKKVKALMPFFSNVFNEQFKGVFKEVIELKYDSTSRTVFLIEGDAEKNSQHTEWDKSFWNNKRVIQHENRLVKNYENKVNDDIDNFFENTRILFYTSKAKIYENSPILRDTVENQDLKKLIKETRKYFGSNNLIEKYLSNGIGVITGDIPIVIRSKIQHLFTKKIINKLVANSAIKSGVNFEIEYIVFNSKRTPKTDGSRSLMTSMANLLGRVGRRNGSRNIRHGKILVNDSYVKSPFENSKKLIDQNKVETNSSIEKSLSDNRKETLKIVSKNINKDILSLTNLDKEITLETVKKRILEVKHENISDNIEIKIDEDKGYEFSKIVSKKVTQLLLKYKSYSKEIENKINKLLCNNFEIFKEKSKWKYEKTPTYLVWSSFLNNCSEYESEIYNFDWQYKIHDELHKFKLCNQEIKLKLYK